MKSLLLSLSLFLIITSARSQAYEGTVEYNKKKQTAVIVEYPFTPEAVENAILDRMQKLGYRGKEEKGLFNNDKGFRNFKNASITDITAVEYDYVIKVERKSRKQDDRSVVYLIMMKNDQNAMSSMEASMMTKAKQFLNNLMPDIEASALEIGIKDQEEVVTKAEKKLKSLQDDKKSMEDKIRKLEDDIKDNIKQQEQTSKDIESQKLALDALKQRRRS